MEIISKAVYIVNYVENKLETRKIPDKFNEYIKTVIEIVRRNDSIRQYKIRNKHTQIVAIIRQLVKNTYENISSTESSMELFKEIAARLLRVEETVQDKINKLNQQVKKGTLIQAVIQENNKYLFLLAKVEHSNWIDDADFSEKTGFPRDRKRIWKSCVFECSIDENGDVVFDDIQVYLDGIAKYWHDEFLELDEMTNDETNTKRAFRAIENTLQRTIKVISPNDYVVLRNSVIGKMRKNDYFDYNIMIDEIFNEYNPANETCCGILEELKGKLKKLPEAKNFDRQFTTVPAVITAKIKKIYTVNDSIEIKIKDFVGDICNTIQAFSDEDGKQYIKILTTNQETYNAFNQKR